MGTPGFRISMLVDEFMKEKQLTGMVFQCTAREADNLGRFMCELLKEFQSWHKDRTLYEKMALGPKKDLPGFAKKLNPDRTPQALLDYEDFRRLLYKWESNFAQAMATCLNSGEFMHIRNAILILKAVSPQYPIVNWHGNKIKEAVTTLKEMETREDMKLLALSLLATLNRGEPSWILPQAFREGTAGPTPARNASRAGSARLSTPQPSDGTPKLNASAPEFKPTTAT